MPGRVKTSSTTTVPPSRMPICRPATVTTGISALRSACLSTTRCPASPLAAAVRMYSEPSTSSMQEHDHEVAPRVGPEVHPHHRRHPAEVEGEEQDQHGALPEHRHREPEEGAHPGHVVHRLVAADRRHDAGRGAEHEGEGGGEEGQLE